MGWKLQDSRIAVGGPGGERAALGPGVAGHPLDASMALLRQGDVIPEQATAFSLRDCRRAEKQDTMRGAIATPTGAGPLRLALRTGPPCRRRSTPSSTILHRPDGGSPAANADAVRRSPRSVALRTQRRSPRVPGTGYSIRRSREILTFAARRAGSQQAAAAASIRVTATEA